MYSYINGVVTEIYNNAVALDNNGIGYFIYTASPYSFKENETYKIYIYQNVREDEISLYGFKSSEEKALFLKLIEVKGLGCKTALPMIAGSPDGVIEAVEKEDISYLKKFPKIGDKIARQIILDLKGKLISTNENHPVREELKEALKSLGYKQADINKVIDKVSSDITLEKQIKEALKLLLK